jgi:hypothetical protein
MILYMFINAILICVVIVEVAAVSFVVICQSSMPM